MKYIVVIINLIKWIAPAICFLAAAACSAIVLVFIYKALKSLAFSSYIERQKIRKIERKQNRRAKKGAWLFPSECFFRKCSEHYISTFDSDYSVQKATNIIIELAGNDGIRRENLETYLLPAQFHKYYTQGKEIADKKDLAETLQKKQPSKAVPVHSESVFLHRIINLAALSGLDKRKQMLTDLLNDYQDRIKVKKESEAPLGVFEKAMILQPQEESSWHTSANNALSNYNTFYLMIGVPDLPFPVEQLEECANDVAAQLEHLNNKVVLSNPTATDILSNLCICKTEAQKGDSGVLHITLSLKLKKSFELDIPQGINMVIDGVLRGTVMFEDIPVGEILFPLPLYGIPCNTAQTIRLTGLCPFYVESDQNVEAWSRFMEYDSPLNTNLVSEALRDILEEDTNCSPAGHSGPKYTVKIASTQNLWIMEK